VTCAGIVKKLQWGLEETSRNRVVVLARLATSAGGIDSLESMPRLRKSLKIRALCSTITLANMGDDIMKFSVILQIDAIPSFSHSEQ
jgi:hypothetical protein